MQSIRTITSWGKDSVQGPLSREAAALAAGTTQKVFASISGHKKNSRQGVSICFLSGDTSDSLYVRLVTRGDPTPTVSSTNADYVIPANQTLPIHCEGGVDLYVQHSASGTLNYTASEWG